MAIFFIVLAERNVTQVCNAHLLGITRIIYEVASLIFGLIDYLKRLIILLSATYFLLILKGLVPY